MTWHEISPAVFGAMFQNAMDPDKRRKMGAHYTTEENILRVIKPLFLDDLNQEFNLLIADIKDSPNHKVLDKKLDAFHHKICNLKFLDPACGCGNFLLITYRELRRLENKYLAARFGDKGSAFISLFFQNEERVSIDQFYGIEIEDWPAEIAHLSMWLMQHVMNQETKAQFGVVLPSIPLRTSAVIKQANALTIDWNLILPVNECSYILGNPPFAGAVTTSKAQKQWLREVYPPKYKINRADFVTAWFVKAAVYMKGNKQIKAALVATNSICQGQQVNILWGLLLSWGIKLNFAYTSFPWSNQASHAATVTCIIVGFSYIKNKICKLFVFNHQEKSFMPPKLSNGGGISPYLILTDKPNSIVKRHNTALSAPLNLRFGNMPIDNGSLLLSQIEKQDFLFKYPEYNTLLKKFIGSSELINSTYRYCLWLSEKNQSLWQNNPEIMQRIEYCKAFRLSSTAQSTIKTAAWPWRFAILADPANPKSALVIPRVSSENRDYIPMAMIDHHTIVSDAAFILPDASNYEFGIITSRLHMCWMRFTAGKLESRYRYSRDLTYNTFIWPQVSEDQRQEICDLAQQILDIRDGYFDKTLGELYNRNSMPLELAEAHHHLDLAVEALYRSKPFESDDERVAFMLNLYVKAAGD